MHLGGLAEVEETAKGVATCGRQNQQSVNEEMCDVNPERWQEGLWRLSAIVLERWRGGAVWFLNY